MKGYFGKSKSKQDYETPEWFMRYLESLYGPFILDAASNGTNSKCEKCYTPKEDGLSSPWIDQTFCNPPFKKIQPWVDKAIYEAMYHDVKSVLLLPDSTSARWFRRDNIYAEVNLLNPRLVYKNAPKAVPFGSMIMRFTKYTVGSPRQRISLLCLPSRVGHVQS